MLTWLHPCDLLTWSSLCNEYTTNATTKERTITTKSCQFHINVPTVLSLFSSSSPLSFTAIFVRHFYSLIYSLLTNLYYLFNLLILTCTVIYTLTCPLTMSHILMSLSRAPLMIRVSSKCKQLTAAWWPWMVNLQMPSGRDQIYTTRQQVHTKYDIFDLKPLTILPYLHQIYSHPRE